MATRPVPSNIPAYGPSMSTHIAAMVDAPDPRREPRDERGQDQHQRGRGQEGPRNPVVNQSADGIPEGHGVHSLKADTAGSPIAREARDTGASIALPWTPQPPSPRPLPCSTIGSARGRLVSGSSDSDTPAFHSPSCSLTRAFR